METEEELLTKLNEKLAILRGLTDTSFLEKLVTRLGKTKDKEVQGFLLSKIRLEYQRLEANFPAIDPSFPVIKSKEGILNVGEILYNGQVISRFSLSLEDINRNMLIIGSTGHGKTSFIYKILSEADKQGLKYLVFDLKKDYAALALSENTIYIDFNDLRVNPLEPPEGMTDKEWAVHFADIFSDSFSLLIGSRDYLLEHTVGLFSTWNKDYPPSLQDLLSYIIIKGKRNDYFKVLEGRLKSLVSSSSLFDCNYGISFHNLKDKNIILGIENFGISEQHFLVSFTLSLFYYANLGRNENKNFKRLIVIDDAHSILDVNQEKDYAKGIPVLHSIIAKIRELGFGFIFSDQQVSSIISSAIQNTNTKFIGRVNLLSDIYKLFPPDYKITEEIAKLNKGEFILLNEAVIPSCVFRADNYNPDKNVNPSLLELKRSFDKKFLQFFKADEMPFNAQEFIKEVSSNPFFNLTMHKSQLSGIMAQEEFNGIKKEFMERGILSEIELLMQNGKTYKFLFLNKDNIKKLNINAINLRTFDRPSFLKYILKNLIGNYLRSKNITYEDDENGFLIKGLMKIYIFLDQNTANLVRILETSFDKVIFVTQDSVDEGDVLSDIIKHGNMNSTLNIKNLKVVHFSEFRL